MKTTKKNVKETKKTVKPLFTMKLDGAVSPDDFFTELVQQKFEVGMSLRPEEVLRLIGMMFDLEKEFMNMCEIISKHVTTKKTPWYKRIWNKIFHKK